MKLIHYGSPSFNEIIYTEIKNGWWIKPSIGGLWTSPIDSKWGWKDWCEVEQFRECTKENSFCMELTKDCKILKIDSEEDTLELVLVQPKSYGEFTNSIRVIDFEKIALKYDAIWLTEKGEQRTRYINDGKYTRLYGWDCETVLILNQKAIHLI